MKQYCLIGTPIRHSLSPAMMNYSFGKTGVDARYGLRETDEASLEKTVREMISSQQGKGGITVDSPYGLNVERVKNLISGKTLYGHQGMANGVLCNLYFDPETRFVFALVTNGTNVRAKEDLFSLMWETYAK